MLYFKSVYSRAFIFPDFFASRDFAKALIGGFGVVIEGFRVHAALHFFAIADAIAVAVEELSDACAIRVQMPHIVASVGL